METNTEPRTFGPGTYVVHGELDIPDPRTWKRPKASWTVILRSDGSGDQYAEDGTHTYAYSVEEEPSEVLRSWEDSYGFRVERVN